MFAIIIQLFSLYLPLVILMSLLYRGSLYQVSTVLGAGAQLNLGGFPKIP